MHTIVSLLQQVPEIEEKLLYVFKDKRLLLLAFVHRSFFNEHRAVMDQHNERLEFLGDCILGLLVSDYLYRSLPESSEGDLSHLRAHIVEAHSCMQFAQQLGIAPFVLLGKGERMNDGRGRETILADLFEALIGAIYLDGGIEEARRFFFGHFQTQIDEAIQQPLKNWKAQLQDYSQKKHQKPPIYRILKETGPDHGKIFHVAAYIDETAVGEGSGSSKKEAEQSAAENALSKMGAVHG
jgi:ribonuclease-3